MHVAILAQATRVAKGKKINIRYRLFASSRHAMAFTDWFVQSGFTNHEALEIPSDLAYAFTTEVEADGGQPGLAVAGSPARRSGVRIHLRSAGVGSVTATGPRRSYLAAPGGGTARRRCEPRLAWAAQV